MDLGRLQYDVVVCVIASLLMHEYHVRTVEQRSTMLRPAAMCRSTTKGAGLPVRTTINATIGLRCVG